MKKIENLNQIIDDYDLILSDVWGVIHNGVEPFESSVTALEQARAKGKKVILITNAPSPKNHVIDLLENNIGISSIFYDDIVTSGDVAKSIINKWSDKKCFHIGLHEREENQVQPEYSQLTDLDNADYVLSTFLAKKSAVELEDYAFILNKMKQRNLPFLCSNPDYVVDVGGELYYCAGALAQMYEAIDGEVVYTGKPHAAIYDVALEKAKQLGVVADASRILIIGDSLGTDVPGANRIGSDMLFVADGIHAREFEQEISKQGDDVFSDNFLKFIEDRIAQKQVDVKYYMSQLA